MCPAWRGQLSTAPGATAEGPRADAAGPASRLCHLILAAGCPPLRLLCEAQQGSSGPPGVMSASTACGLGPGNPETAGQSEREGRTGPSSRGWSRQPGKEQLANPAPGDVAGVAEAARGGGGQEAPAGGLGAHSQPPPRLKAVAWQEGPLSPLRPQLGRSGPAATPGRWGGALWCRAHRVFMSGRVVSSLAPPGPLCRKRPARSRAWSGWKALSLGGGAHVPHGRSVSPQGQKSQQEAQRARASRPRSRRAASM